MTGPLPEDDTIPTSKLLTETMPHPTEWKGCGHCDPLFGCHEGKAACIRRPAGQIDYYIAGKKIEW